jgi:hypothetical protein
MSRDQRGSFFPNSDHDVVTNRRAVLRAGPSRESARLDLHGSRRLTLVT